MNTQTHIALNVSDIAVTLNQFSKFAIRYSLVVIFVWFGLQKFSVYETNAIAGLASNSPIFALLHKTLGVQGFSNFKRD